MPAPAASLDRLAELTPDLLATLSPRGEATCANPAWRRAFGPMSWPQALHPDDRAAAEAALRRAVLEHEATVEARVRDERGRFRAVEFRLVGDAERRAVHAHGRDVSRRAAAERRGRLAAARLDAVAGCSRHGIVGADGHGRITEWSAGAQRAFGWHEREILGKPLSVLMPERYRAAHRARLAGLLADDRSRVAAKTLEVEGVRRDGTEFPMELSLAHAEVDGAHALTAIVRDVSDHVEARTRLRAAEQRFAEAFEGAAVPMALVLPGGTLLQVNPAFCALTGHDAPALQRLPLEQLLEPADRAAPSAALDRLVAGAGTRWSGDLRIAHPSGEARPVRCHAGLIRSDDGLPLHFIITLEVVKPLPATVRVALAADRRGGRP